MGECPGGDGNDLDGWGGPACDNREPARTTRTKPITARQQLAVLPKPEHYYKVGIDVVTLSGKTFSFETEMDSRWTLVEIAAVARKRAISECEQRSERIDSNEIKSLVLV